MKARFAVAIQSVLLLAGPGALHAAAVDSPRWDDERATVRFEISADPSLGHDSGDRRCVSVSVCPAGMNPEKLIPSLFSRSGEQAGCRTLYARCGEPMQLILDSAAFRLPRGSSATPDENPSCFLYLSDAAEPGGRERWAPCAGLILEMRTCTNSLRELSVAEFEAMWRQAGYTNGSKLVHSIHHALPVLPVTERVPREYASYVPEGLLLNRYRGTFRYAKDLDALDEARATLALAEKEKLEIVEKAEEAHFKLREAEYELLVTGMFPDVIKVSVDVLRKRLYARLKEYEALGKKAKARVDRTILSTSNRIEEITSGKHTFFIGSRGGSHLLIDGKKILTWPADRALSRYHGRYINLDSTSVALDEGLHTLEYLHYARADNTMASVACRRPGEDQARKADTSLFLPVANGNVESVSGRNPSDQPLMFSWQTEEDLRCPSANDMVHMSLSVTSPQPGCRYSWDLGDGFTAVGTEMAHLYLLTGPHTVVLSEYSTSNPRATRTVTQIIDVHVLWTKHNLADLSVYETMITQMDFANTDMPALLNAYEFARKSATEEDPLHDWREHLGRTLIARLAEIPSNEFFHAVHVADDARCSRVERHDEARLAYEAALQRLGRNDPVRINAILGYSDLLVNCYGDAESGIEVLNELGDGKHASSDDRLRMQLLRANAMLAAGRRIEAEDLLKSISSFKPQEATRLAIKQRAELRHARGLTLKSNPSPDELTLAMEKMDLLVREDPRLALSPELNLVKLDVLLGCRKYAEALHFANRTLNLELTDAVRPAVLARRVEALYRTGDIEAAEIATKELAAEYPYSPEITRSIPAELRPRANE